MNIEKHGPTVTLGREQLDQRQVQSRIRLSLGWATADRPGLSPLDEVGSLVTELLMAKSLQGALHHVWLQS